MHDYTSTLDDRQAEAVLHTHGPLLVLAGAGSGKTRVLTHRIARLVGEKHCVASEILALTFTNKAAKEMRKRVAGQTSKTEANQMTICTFHSLGVKILREFGQYLKLNANFTILSDNERISTLKMIMRSSGKTVAQEDPTVFGSAISLAKNGNLSPDAYGDQNPDQRKVVKVYSAYQKILLKRQSVDFDDLLLLPIKLFTEHPRALEKFRSKYKFISVDEFQDTNTVQMKLTRMIVHPHYNLMVVGDDDQGIYSWRGAEIENIINFPRHFKGTKTVILNKNYRSTAQIVDGANGVVARNTKRKAKQIISFAGQGEPIVTYKAENEQKEVEWIVEQIFQFDKLEMFPFGKQAILFRANAQMRRFEEELRSRRIPYKVQGGSSFFDRKEVKDILSYLNFFSNTDDELSLARVLTVPHKGIAPSTIAKLEELAGMYKCSLWDAFRKYEEIRDDVDPNQYMSVEKFVGFAEEFIHRFSEQVPSKALRELLKQIQYIELVTAAYKQEKSLEMRLENIQEMISALEHYEHKRGDDAGLAGFLQNLTLKSGEKEEGPPRGVTLMTLHKSKGLEYPVVFMPILDDAVMPSKRSREEGLLEEERRLFYVGMTRAEKRLFLTFPKVKLIAKNEVKVRESRFLHEIPEECLDGPIGQQQDEEFQSFKDDFFKKMQGQFGGGEASDDAMDHRVKRR